MLVSGLEYLHLSHYPWDTLCPRTQSIYFLYLLRFISQQPPLTQTHRWKIEDTLSMIAYSVTKKIPTLNPYLHLNDALVHLMDPNLT